MFQPTDPQLSLLESHLLMPPAKAARLRKSWAEPFRTRVLPMIDEEVFREAYCEDNGRPNVPVRLLAALHLLKDVDDLTDEQVLEQFEFNLQWHYATGVDPDKAHVCQKTLHNFRVKLLGNERARRMFETVTRGLAEMDGVSVTRQRLDSTHALSNMAVLTRLGLFVETVTNFLRELRRGYPDKLAALDAGYVKRYLEREGYFADAKREQGRRRLPAVAEDMFRLVRAFEHDGTVSELGSYQLLARLFTEQCEVVVGATATAPAVQVGQMPHETAESGPAERASDKDDNGGTRPGVGGEEPQLAESGVSATEREDEGEAAPAEASASPATSSESVRLRDGKEIAGNSLQSPHDPDATYGHKGKGYEVQLTETCGDGNPYQLITGVAVNGANESDQAAVVPMISKLDAAGLLPNELLADTGYGSGDNIVAAAKANVELVAPVQDPDAAPAMDPWASPVERPALSPNDTIGAAGRAVPRLGLDAFDFNKVYDAVLACLGGHPPALQITDKTGKVCATFSAATCGNCPSAGLCPTQQLKSGDRKLRFSPASAATAHRQRLQATPGFKERYKVRSGIEATNSEFKGRHGAGRLRVRGGHRVSLAETLKAMAVNVKRACEYHVTRLRQAAQAAQAELADCLPTPAFA